MIVLISRMPVTAISKVRGIGVADIASTSTRRTQPLELFLVLDAEALLLIDHDKAQVLEFHLIGQQSVSAHDDVDPAVGETFDGRSSPRPRRRTG